MFESLAGNAFSLRLRLKAPIVKAMVQPFCTFLYKSKGIEGALQHQFGQDAYLFGPPANGPTDTASPLGADWVKVGVVSCLEGRNIPILIANYSRNPSNSEGGADYLARQDNQEDDFKVWEAARATSAAPVYFEPFTHKQASYIDGGVARNNPAQLAFDEYQKIWPDSPQPDVLVSLGTGVVVDPNSGDIHEGDRRMYDTLMPMIPAGVRRKIETGYDMVKSTMDCHKAWVDFKQSISHNRRLVRNCHRLNVGLTRRVNLDGVQFIDQLQADSLSYLNPRPKLPYLDEDYGTAFEHLTVVARRLLATLFYYKGPLQEQMTTQRVNGWIFCRLRPGSRHAENLLRENIKFQLRQVPRDSRRILKQDVRYKYSEPFDPADLSADIHFKVDGGLFNRYIVVNLPGWGNTWEPISGF
ncbi:acyl transferase/acyl hydrolase/lysophospholipase [Thelonectria olida]|uniref:Acyl transferase/acyl hydrolase/lysophospholipase n=1 Tax=Thelonectria olida TaxID=1576542 RepID=A0A9P8VWL5_9HYPO|nr:acyl transferase/acyl hydrolase/lysophospholipase [Thelonectria olida]